MRIQTLSAFLLAAVLAGCGGGGGPGNNMPPPPPSVALPITLAETGSFGAADPSKALSGFQVLNTRSEYDAFVFGTPGPNNPSELRELDYTQFSVLYVEGPATDALGDTARVIEIRRTNGTQDSVRGERCMSDPNGIPTPSRAHRPYAYYIIPKLMAGATFSWSTVATNCVTVTRVDLAFIASSEWGFPSNLPSPPPGSVIRSQAELDAVLPSFAPGAVPVQYLRPDFTQVTLILVQMWRWMDPSYVRVHSVLVNDDGSRDAIAEFCGRSFAHVAFAGTLALYAVPRFNEDLRTTVIRHLPGTCVLPP